MSAPEDEQGAEQRPPRDERPSVIQHVLKKTGMTARVLLHDSDSAEGGPPIVDPKSRDAVHFPAARHHYQVLGEIARGGMGVVLKAQDTELGREVAIKVLDERFAGEEAVLQRFVEEAQIGGQLQHPGVVPVYELGLLDDERPFIAMKLVKGRTLSALLSDRKSPADGRRRFLTTFESVCQAVAYAHSKGVIHRDLKPANVMVGAFGEVQVGDWGLAKVLGKGGIEDEERARRSQQTIIETLRSGPGSSGTDSMVGSVMGTPAYMPPEQAMGQIEKIDERSDVFALGGILCEILTGKPPYVGTEKERTVVQAAHGRIDTARERIEACEADGELKALALECLAPALTVRPRNADEVARRVHEHMASADERTRAAELAAAEALVKVAAARRERVLTLGLAATVVLAVVSVGAFLRSRTMNRIEQVAEVRDRLDDGVEQVLALRGSGQLTEALEIARNTAGLVRDSQWAEDEDRERVARLVAETEARVEDQAAELDLEQRNERILAELEELRFEQLDLMMSGRGAELVARYTTIFEAYGAPVDLEDPDLFVEAVRYSGIETELASALDGWAWIERSRRNATADWSDYEARLLTFLAMDIDDDVTRAEVRNAILEADAARLGEFMMEAGERGHSAETQFTVVMSLFQFPPSSFEESEGFDMRDVTAGLYPADFLMNCIEVHTMRREDRHDAAIPALRAAIALRPESLGMRYLFAESLTRTGDLLAALDQYELTRERGHLPSGSSYSIGIIQWDLGEYAQAVAAIEHALALTSDQRGWGVDLEAVRYLAGATAREAFIARVAEISSNTPGELVGFAVGLMDHPSSNPEDARLALEACQRAQALGSTDDFLSQVLGDALLELGRVEDAERELDAWELRQTHQNPLEATMRSSYRARCFHRLGEAERARAELLRAQHLAGMVVGDERARWNKSRMMRLLREAEQELDG